MIKITDLQFSYGQYNVLSNIDLVLEPGKVYGLLGKNGVGKTTLLALLAGLKRNKKGLISVDGFNPKYREPDFLDRIYFLPDEPGISKFTVLDYAKETGKFWSGFSLDKFKEIIELWGNRLEQRMDRMSAGELKKTYISFALACNTRYIFMDEPTNALDIPSKAIFRRVITKYTSEDTTILISTHLVRDLENIIDPIIILDNKSVLLNATIEEITSKLYFDYGNEKIDNALYTENIPGGRIQVYMNQENKESKVNIEALFNTIMQNKDLINTMFNTK